MADYNSSYTGQQIDNAVGTVLNGSRFIPSGGTEGQVLLKNSETDYDAVWGDIDRTPLSIAVTTNPTKMSYEQFDEFDPTGMLVTLTYSDGSSRVIANVTQFTFTPSVLATAGSVTITVSWTDGEFILTTTLTVTVTAVTINTFPTVQKALNADYDFSSMLGEQVTNVANNTTLTWDIVDYDSTNDEVTLLMHGLIYMIFDPNQATGYFPNGLGAGAYCFDYNSTTYYFTLSNAVPSESQIVLKTSSFAVYSSKTSASASQSGSVSTTAIPGAINLGTCGSSNGTYPLNHMDRVGYGSANILQSGVQDWLNSDEAGGVTKVGTLDWSRPLTTNAGFLYGWDADDLACVADTVWSCYSNGAYEAPSSVGGTVEPSQVYTFTAKVSLPSSKEIFNRTPGFDYGGHQFGLYEDALATDIIKYYNGTAKIWFLRTPYSGNCNQTEISRADGMWGVTSAAYDFYVAPCLKIRKQTA